MSTIYEAVDYLIELYEGTEENNRNFSAWYYAEARPCFATGELFKRKRPSYHHFNPKYFAVVNHLVDCASKKCSNAITWDDLLFHDDLCEVCNDKRHGCYDHNAAQYFGDLLRKYGTF